MLKVKQALNSAPTEEKSEFGLFGPNWSEKGPNFIISPSYNSYFTLIHLPTTVEVQQICKRSFFQPCTAVCAT